MNLKQLKTKYKDLILDIAQNRNIDNIRIFGSVAKGVATKNSDVDFLVHMRPEADLIDLSGFCLDLEELLKCKVDVIPDQSIHWSLKDQILSEALPI